MGRRKQKKVNMSYVTLGAILVVFVMIVIAINNMLSASKEVSYTGKPKGEIEIATGQDPNIAANKDESETELLKKMTERARIEHYVKKFMDFVEAENYDEAYSLLNETYKENYFSSKLSFEQYCKKNFTKMMDCKYTNFERSGEVYVIWMTVTDGINGNPNEGKEFNFVVKEHAYNDFELSFSAE